MDKILQLFLILCCTLFFIDSDPAYGRLAKSKYKETRLKKNRFHHTEAPSDQEENDNEDSDPDDVDSAEDGSDNGPWRVSVPREYQKNGYSLRIGSKWQTLSTSEIMLVPRELPQYVSLIDGSGRIEQRKRKMINQHLLTGFHPRHFRVSGFVGGGTLQGDLVDEYELSGTQTNLGFDGYYQPGSLGFLLGFENIRSSSTSDLYISTSYLKLGGSFETGLFYRGPHYRWHQLFQGGLALGGLSIIQEKNRGNTSDTPGNDDKSKTLAQGSAVGPFASLDSLYMFQNWWWGGRLYVTYFKTKSRPVDQQNGDTPKKSTSDFNDSSEITRTLLSSGIALVGSFTW